MRVLLKNIKLVENLNIVKSKESVSVMLVTDGKVSIASADNLMDGRWWISRVKLQGVQTGKGFGSILLKKLLAEILSFGNTKIIVAPGGYGENTIQQFNFYKKNGFVDTKETGLLIYKI